MIRAAMSERICFLHIGTHKTGTTTIQDVLTRDPTVLATHGIYVPRAGRFGAAGGHHNLEEELNRSPNFDPSHGDLASLAREIAGCNAPTVVISSENLEHLFTRPEALERLRQTLDDAGFRTRVVVYLRNRYDYARSLYLELRKHGLETGFDHFLDEIVATGVITLSGSGRAYSFEYGRILDAFADVFHRENIVARHYDAAAANIVRDFFSIAGWTTAMIEKLGSVPTLNVTNAAAAITIPKSPTEADESRMLHRFTSDRLRVADGYKVDTPIT